MTKAGVKKMKSLIHHKVNETLRSTVFVQSMVASVVILLLVAYMASVLVFLSLQADVIISKLYVGQDILAVFTGFMFYYFVYDLLIRFLFQDIPTLGIKPYLTLAVKKSSLLHYVLKTSLLSVFNALGILLITPFFIKNIWANYSTSNSIAWLLSFFLLILVNNYLTVWLKRLFAQRPFLVIALFALFVSATVLECFGKLPLSVKFSNLILELVQQPLYILAPTLLVIITYYVAYTSLRRNSYIEDVAKKKRNGNAYQFSFLKQFGELGSLIALDFKLITRNKRPRSLVLIGSLFMLYGFMFYKDSMLNNYYMLMMAGFFITCMFSINYGQFIFSWEGTYFDFLSSSHINTQKYIESKYQLLSGVSIVTFLLTLPYAFIDSKIALINTALVIYNIGFTNVLIIGLATFNTSSIDLGRSQMMNYQGVGAIQYLNIVPIMGIPVLFIFLFSLIDHPLWAFALLALLGGVSLIYRSYLLNKVAELLQKRKHKMLVGFRQG